MGIYVNPGFDKFEMSLNSEIYIDKSNLITQTNALIRTEQRFICISRPRRFGKTMAAHMLAAYYGQQPCNLFTDLNIASHPSFETHLNKYNVLMINVQVFLSQNDTVEAMLSDLQNTITSELAEQYPEARLKNKDRLVQVMNDIHMFTGKQFVILLDEWDCLFREYKLDTDAQRKYLDFLRLWFKDQAYVAMAYMTGILPIKKYGSHSALNMFDEYSMVRPHRFLEYFGFTETEVETLADEHNMDFDEVKKWYNGYFTDIHIPMYSPRSVKSSMVQQSIDNFWINTETYDALKDYIHLDFDGLREKVITLIAGDNVAINERTFANDMTTFSSASDVLTLLVHLGYLTYNFDKKTVKIPNEEVKHEFISSVETLRWDNVINAVKKSQKLLEAIWDGDSVLVAEGVQLVHEQNTSIIQYNDENSLSSIISLALYTATEYYWTIRELPTGKGYSDIIYIPRKNHTDKPALVVELKWDKTAVSAIDKIKNRNYTAALEEYEGNILLVVINYDKQEKNHECIIETWVK